MSSQRHKTCVVAIEPVRNMLNPFVHAICEYTKHINFLLEFSHCFARHINTLLHCWLGQYSTYIMVVMYYQSCKSWCLLVCCVCNCVIRICIFIPYSFFGDVLIAGEKIRLRWRLLSSREAKDTLRVVRAKVIVPGSKKAFLTFSSLSGSSVKKIPPFTHSNPIKCIQNNKKDSRFFTGLFNCGATCCSF